MDTRLRGSIRDVLNIVIRNVTWVAVALSLNIALNNTTITVVAQMNITIN